MTIASLLLALVVTTAAPAPASAGGGDPVLLDFHASWCGPCQKMRPEVAKLVGKQYPIQSVDLDRSREIAEKYNVRAVPTFIVVDGSGQVLGRREGYTPAADLAAFYNKAVLKAGDTARASETRAEVAASDAEAPEGREPAPPARAANPKPWETVVRIKIHLNSKEWAYGSGTIIYSDATESIILTCAHIFKDGNKRTPLAQFRKPIAIDLFDGKVRFPDPNRREQAGQLACIEKDIPGEAIDYDFDNDVGLIRIRPGRTLAASRVVPESWEPRRGLPMYSVGCSHGNDATAWTTQILEPAVRMKNVESGRGFTEIKCTNEPSQGRSGGGLYTADGYLAGVCDFADPNDHVGLYATPKAIYHLLDRAHLASLYREASPGESNGLLASNNRPDSRTIARLQSPGIESDQPAGSARNFPIPPAGMFGIPDPETRVASRDSRGNHWQSPGQVAQAGSRADGRPRRTAAPDQPSPRELELGSIDPGVFSAGPIPSDATINRSDAAPAADGEGRPEAEPDTSPRRPSALGKWKPVQPSAARATNNR